MKGLAIRIRSLFDVAYSCSMATPHDKIDWQTDKVDGTPVAEWISKHAKLSHLSFSIQEKDIETFVDLWQQLMTFIQSHEVCAFVRTCVFSIFVFCSFHRFYNRCVVFLGLIYLGFLNFSYQDFLTIRRLRS